MVGGREGKMDSIQLVRAWPGWLSLAVMSGVTVLQEISQSLVM